MRMAPAARRGWPDQGVDRSHKGQPAPDVRFNDPDGDETSLAAFRKADARELVGDVVRALRQGTADAQPAGQARGAALHVVAVSQDRGPHRRSWRSSMAKVADLERLSGPEDGAVGSARCRECCRPRSCTMPRARKSGAMSATSTGRARKRLGCSRKPARRQSADQPPVDRREAERDQAEADEVLRRELLAEEQRRRAGSRPAAPAGSPAGRWSRPTSRSAGNRARSRRRCRTTRAR